MERFSQLIRATILSFAVVASAQALPLSTLLAGGTLGAGGLAFTHFSASYATSDPLRVFNAGNIDVTAIPDGSPFGAGLRFMVREGELTVQGAGAHAFIDLRMGFRVAALDPASPASGVALTMTSNGIDMRQQDHGVTIAHHVRGGPGMAGFLSQPELWVASDLLVWAADRGDTAALIVFSQHYDLEVPEPGSLPLLAVAGLAAMAVLGKRRPTS
ncbi:PEP-CTERM sorting domain-containing protein [Pseudoduganella lutea]|nr:PEP-CTERM sorting domain-containing protein [Pseudoduganella lutea]